MGLKLCAAGLCAAAIALGTIVATPVDAVAEQNKKAVSKQKVTKSAPRAKVVVRRRSFLDAGTEVLPGDGGYTNYALPPGYSPTSVIENRAGVYRSPLPGPYDLPSRQNPYPWNWCVGC